jgi:hypothetical protein
MTSTAIIETPTRVSIKIKKGGRCQDRLIIGIRAKGLLTTRRVDLITKELAQEVIRVVINKNLNNLKMCKMINTNLLRGKHLLVELHLLIFQSKAKLLQINHLIILIMMTVSQTRLFLQLQRNNQDSEIILDQTLSKPHQAWICRNVQDAEDLSIQLRILSITKFAKRSSNKRERFSIVKLTESFLTNKNKFCSRHREMRR